MKYVLKAILYVLGKLFFWTIVTISYLVINGARIIWEFKRDVEFFEAAEMFADIIYVLRNGIDLTDDKICIGCDWDYIPCHTKEIYLCNECLNDKL